MGRKLLIFVMLGAAVALAVSLLWRPEPVCGGHRLSYWLDVYTVARYQWPDPVPPATRQEAEHAPDMIQAIGPAAIPYLLKWIAYEPSPMKTKFIDFMGRLRGGRPRGWIPEYLTTNRAARRRFSAAEGFCILGQAAQSAAPELLRHLTYASNPGTAGDNARALAGIGPEGLSALSDFLTNSNRRIIAESKSWARFSAINAIQTLETNAAPAVPALVQCLQDKDENVVWFAARALGWLNLCPELVIPALSDAARSTNRNNRYIAVLSLERLGHNHRNVVPALLPALRDPDAEVREKARYALANIAPEALTNAPAGAGRASPP
jgi:HEAT repeat protein